jgi:RNA ligase (TIGR02306 family)
MEKSTHRVEVVPVVLEPHPNADTLSIVRVFGYQVCVRTADWEGVGVGAYIVPDSVVPVDRDEFKFLEDPKKPGQPVRVRVRKMRGVISYGLLIKAPSCGCSVGDDIAELLGVTRYEAPVKLSTGGFGGSMPTEREPEVEAVVYDVEAFQRYAQTCFVQGEPVYVSEKVDGANARFCFYEGQMFVGSRKNWYKPHDSLAWYVALSRHPEIEACCRSMPGAVLYGEIFGWVQGLRYGRKPGEVDFVAFDVRRFDLGRGGKWMPIQEFHPLMAQFGIAVAPPLPYAAKMSGYTLSIPYDFDKLMALAEGPSLIPGAKHYREGIVVKPITERWSQGVGRVQLKIVSAMYLENDGKEKEWKS